MRIDGNIAKSISASDIDGSGCLRFPDEVELISLDDMIIDEMKFKRRLKVKRLELNNICNIITSAHHQGFSAVFIDLEEVSAPRMRKINDFLFTNCTHLKKVSFESAEIVGLEAFCSCKVLNTVKIPNVQSIEGAAFFDSGIEEFDVPVTLKTIGVKAFADTFLREINLKNVEKVYAEAFKGCSQLKIIKARSISAFGEAFSLSGAYNLETLILDLPNSTDNYPFIQEGNTYTVKDLMTGRVVQCVSGPRITGISKSYLQKIQYCEKYGKKVYIYTFTNGKYALDNLLYFEWDIPLEELTDKLKAI